MSLHLYPVIHHSSGKLYGRVNTETSTWRIADRDRARKRRSRSIVRSSHPTTTTSAAGSGDAPGPQTSQPSPRHAHTASLIGNRLFRLARPRRIFPRIAFEPVRIGRLAAIRLSSYEVSRTRHRHRYRSTLPALRRSGPAAQATWDLPIPLKLASTKASSSQIR